MKIKREKRVTVRFSDEELRKFSKLAESRHTDISEIIRQALHREFADASKTGKAA